MRGLKILCVIPARGGSKNVPRKNIRNLAGEPLIVYTIRAALEVKRLFHRILVSTDDEQIRQVALEAGAEAPFLRPRELSDDKTPMLPVLQHSVHHIETCDKVVLDWVCLLQPTEPLRRSEDIETALATAKQCETDSVISVSRVYAHHPALMKRIEDGRLVSFCVEEEEGTRRQDYQPPAYMRNGSIYLTRRDVLINRKSIWGKSITPYVMPEDAHVSIDTELDFRLAEIVMSDRKAKGHGTREVEEE